MHIIFHGIMLIVVIFELATKLGTTIEIKSSGITPIEIYSLRHKDIEYHVQSKI
jgi:hypothetical protein